MRPPFRLRSLLAPIGLFAIGLPAHAAEITLDATQRFQTISGWEATADLPDQPTAPHWAPYREEQLDSIVEEIGINRIRLEVRSGAESDRGYISRFIAGKMPFEEWKQHYYEVVNDNDDPNVINWDGFDFAELDWHIENTVLPIRKRLEDRGETLIINLCFVSFDDQPTSQRDPEEYAEFVLATYMHVDQKYGFTPDLWEVILEPDLMPNGWTGLEVGRAMEAASRRLRENGYEPAFVAPSVTDVRNAVPYVEAIASVPGAMTDFVELSYHRYRGSSPRRLGQIADLATKYGLRTSMLEWWFGKGTHEVLHEDLTIGQNSSWQGRVESGLHDTKGWPDKPLRPKPEVRYNLQYFRDVRNGAVRIGASSDRRGFDPIAFVNPDGRHVVIVKAGTGGPVAVSGLPAGSYRVSYAVESGSVMLPDPLVIGERDQLQTVMPSAGVLTIAAERGE